MDARFALAIGAATAAVTLLLWGLALRPWAWQWDMQIGPPPQARNAPPVTEAELLVVATAVLIPILVVLICSPAVWCQRRGPRRSG